MPHVRAVPTLVIITGPPASGKSTLAEKLKVHLTMPVISKDLVKEAMAEHLGGAAEVGRATFSVQFAIARELLEAGMDIILEGAFFRAQRQIAELALLAKTVVVDVTCPVEVLEKRYINRHPHRHSGHRGPEALPDLRNRIANHEYGIPAIDAPTLEVDSTEDFKPQLEDVVRWVREKLEEVRDEP